MTVPLRIALPAQSGDHPESVQFLASNGSATSVPVTRRTVIGSGGAFSFTLGSSVARDFGPLQSREVDVPAGVKDLRITFTTPDASADNIIDYFLVAPDGLDGFYDRTPGTTAQGIGQASQKSRAAIVVSDPPPGVWIVQAMIDLTTSGKEFTQTVTGQVSYDTANIQAFNVPNSAAKQFAAGSNTTLRVGVTNTTGVGRTFALMSDNGDITGPNVYIPAGATVLVTGALTPTAAVGTVVSGQLYVVSNGSDLSPLLVSDEFTFDLQTLSQVPYEYTVGAAATTAAPVAG